MTTSEVEIQPKDSSSTSTGMDDLTYDDWADLIYDKWEDLHAADASQLGLLFTPEESKEIDALLKVWIYPVYGQQADLCAADALHEGQRPIQTPFNSEGVFPPKPFVQAPLYFENSAQSCNVTGLNWGVFTKWVGAYRNISPSESSSLPVFYFPPPSFESASPPPSSSIHLASSEYTAVEGQASHIPTYIVGIGGGPSSGKSTLALHLSYVFKKLGQNSRVFTISQDAYILPPADCPQITLRSGKRVVHTNCLFSVDWEEMIKDVNKLKAGNYSFLSGRIRETYATAKGRRIRCPHLRAGDVTDLVRLREATLSTAAKSGRQSFWLAQFCYKTLTDYPDNQEISTSLPSQLILIEGPLMNAVCPTALPPQQSGFGIFRSDTQQKA
ncbi:hypothetical protein CTAM01_03188 [Colletotrichum tamarilloi]|uniref:Uridine kinase n=1 Tax=Colletotrichum tamarilloi TaxID=1209934 RepID=A0ABQ9RMA9_9PEZI|nr:uncharacterized protein CTAM01_03188 [Colletotrichum tamarilloi]KAK1506856.1 hypothetical protein CTAM01_03188 [Colletotrichum tamarilloi]